FSVQVETANRYNPLHILGQYIVNGLAPRWITFCGQIATRLVEPEKLCGGWLCNGVTIDGNSVQIFQKYGGVIHGDTVQSNSLIADHPLNLAPGSHTSAGQQFCNTLPFAHG